jgi:phage terminase small subunit
MRKKLDAKLARELSPKMHKFCLCIVEGDGPSEAYRAAYAASSMSDDSVAVEASRLLRDPRVHARIEELRTSLQRSLGVSRATLLREIDEVRELAKTNGDVKTVLTATMSKARLLGFLDNPPKPTSPSEREVSSVFGAELTGKTE